MIGLARRALAISAVVIMAAAGAPLGASAQPTPGAAPVVELVAQTATVPAGGTFDMRLRIAGVPDDANVELVLYGRVRSRSELAASMAGAQLRGEIYRATRPITALPSVAEGTRRLSLPLDPGTVGAVALTAAGVYPVEIEVQDAAGAPLSSLITHLLVRPHSSDESPPLGVAVVARLDAPPILQPDGSRELSEEVMRGAAELVDSLASTPAVPVTLALRPETIEALAVSEAPSAAGLLDRLRVAAASREAMAVPFVDTSPDALLAADLADELARQLARGEDVLTAVLGKRPRSTTWLAGSDLDVDGLRLLQQQGVKHLVLAPDQVQPLRSGVLSLSLAQPFLVRSTLKPAVDAFALDAAVVERLGTSVSAGLEVSRLLAELAMLWFEQPGIARGVVVPIELSVRGSVVTGLLNALEAGGPFHAVEVDELFTSARALRQPGGKRVDRSLDPVEARPITERIARELRSARSLQSSFVGLVGPDHPRARTVGAHLLLATSSRLSREERSRHIDAARAGIESVTDAVSAPERETITLTARDGTVPLTLRNDSGVPVDVVVRLRSPKLQFPGGDTIALTLTEPTTRLDISVSARASGTFRLDVAVTSPDGELTLATVDYAVQSSAISGVGLFLSAGAGIFLLVWWARHWRRTRRSDKRVAPTEPADPPAR